MAKYLSSHCSADSSTADSAAQFLLDLGNTTLDDICDDGNSKDNDKSDEELLSTCQIMEEVIVQKDRFATR